ncbi:hypothetical protein TNCV_2754901 [Trichonephila clavipes]|nr:hypothetical protein TNCV_2754901 [Trichonephila clavipes]
MGGSLSSPSSPLISGCHTFAHGSSDRSLTPLVSVNNRPARLISTPKQTCVQHLETLVSSRHIFPEWTSFIRFADSTLYSSWLRPYVLRGPNTKEL